jgi:hypothetical protein
MSFCQNCSPHDRAEWRLCGFYMLVREATAADNTEEKTTMPCFPCFARELIQPFGGSSQLIARRRLFCVKLGRFAATFAITYYKTFARPGTRFDTIAPNRIILGTYLRVSHHSSACSHGREQSKHGDPTRHMPSARPMTSGVASVKRKPHTGVASVL